MCNAWIERSWSPWAALVTLAACSSAPPASARDVADANDTGRRVAATSDSDRALLNQLSALPNGRPQRVGDATVIADAPYSAASGRNCRALHLTTSHSNQTKRLACSDGQLWFFVPDVFHGEGSEE
jgi:hypothetical protein